MIINPYLISSGPPPFIPTDIAGCKMWCKADALSLSDGNSVTTWTDSSGSGNAPTSSGTAPIYKTGIMNSLPIVRFAAVGYLSKAFTLNQAFTYFVVVSRAAGVGAAVLDGINNLTATMYCQDTPSNGYAPYSGGFGTFFAATVTNPNILMVVWNGTSSISALNGSETAQSVGTGAAGGITIGAWGNGSSQLTGDIAEVIVYDTALGATNRQSVQAYLAAKYAI